MSTITTERRSTHSTVELRGEPGARKIGGAAIVYGRYSQNLGGYVEQVEPGFVAKSVADRADVLARYQHDSNFLLGRVSAETLRLSDGLDVLDYEADLPDTSYARDLEALAARGDVRHSSFAFRVMPDGDSWGFTEQGYPLRTLNRGGGQLVDVAPVVTPAYLDTTSGLRSLAEQRGLDLDAVRKAAECNELGELLRSGAPVVIDLAPTGPAATGAQGATHAPLSVYRRRLDLLAKADAS
mgnify:FL=1